MATIDPDTLPLDLMTWRYATKAIATLDETGELQQGPRRELGARGQGIERTAVVVPSFSEPAPVLLSRCPTEWVARRPDRFEQHSSHPEAPPPGPLDGVPAPCAPVQTGFR